MINVADEPGAICAGGVFKVNRGLSVTIDIIFKSEDPVFSIKNSLSNDWNWGVWPIFTGSGWPLITMGLEVSVPFLIVSAGANMIPETGKLKVPSSRSQINRRNYQRLSKKLPISPLIMLKNAKN